jgi:hypothetical protein
MFFQWDIGTNAYFLHIEVFSTVTDGVVVTGTETNTGKTWTNIGEFEPETCYPSDMPCRFMTPEFGRGAGRDTGYYPNLAGRDFGYGRDFGGRDWGRGEYGRDFYGGRDWGRGDLYGGRDWGRREFGRPDYGFGDIGFRDWGRTFERPSDFQPSSPFDFYGESRRCVFAITEVPSITFVSLELLLEILGAIMEREVLI